MQKLVLYRYLLNFSLGLCGLILFSDFWTYFSPLKSKKSTQITYALFLATNSIFYNFFNFLELHRMNLKLYSKEYNKNFVLHLIVAPQLSSGWWHDYSTKTRQAGHANEQSMYSPMSMVYSIGHRETNKKMTFWKF